MWLALLEAFVAGFFFEAALSRKEDRFFFACLAVTWALFAVSDVLGR